jgi:TolB-like protein/Flp pilus assembly protein TadD/tRNA A-37 threonylcarbamoyl transferase component Bud32
MIGQTISHYRILEKLGEGGMGVVYKAEDTKLKRTVALKFLPPELTRDKSAKTRFIHEAQAASALQHHNICTIHEIDETKDGQLFIVMDCYDGETLKDKIAEGPLPVWEAVDIASQVAAGLSKAHGAGMVHRDIKPANIMVTADGVAKLLDFGLAKLAGLTKVTRTGTTVGTVAYMSPEQAKGEEVDARSDIFSLGAVLYEMLTGQLPFKGDHEQALVYQIVNGEPEPLNKCQRDIPEDVQRVVSRALQKDPSKRYDAAAAMVDDLAKVAGAPARSVRLSPRWRHDHRRVLLVACLSLIVVATGAVLLVRNFSKGPGLTSRQRKMIVVLPFESLGPPEDEYFADGVTEEITSRLGSVRELGVIARTSAVQYKGTKKSIKEIGRELGVSYVLEGSIRWEHSKTGRERVRITPQLIQVSDATHVWADSYDRVIDDIFDVQSDIAENVFRHLDVALLEPERRRLAEKPTRNMEAYDTYLRGMALLWGPGEMGSSPLVAAGLFEQAVQLDPGFAVAYAALSQAQSFMYHARYDMTETRLSLAKTAADRALELDARLPEAHLALGYYYYWGLRQYDRALQEFEIAAKGLPNDSRPLVGIGAIQRRRGSSEAGLEAFQKASGLSPRDANLVLQVAIAYRDLGRYEEAQRHLDLVIALAPDDPDNYLTKASYYRDAGDVEKARSTLEHVPEKANAVAEHDRWIWAWVDQYIYEREYRTALEFLRQSDFRLFKEQYWFVPRSLLEGRLLWLMGDKDGAKGPFHEASVLLETEVGANPRDPRLYIALGESYAGLGRREDAVREGRRAVELWPPSMDAVDGRFFVSELVRIYIMVGDYDSALEQIEYLLSTRSGRFSVLFLGRDPWFDPLREFPRYKELIAKYSPKVS